MLRHCHVNCRCTFPCTKTSLKSEDLSNFHAADTRFTAAACQTGIAAFRSFVSKQHAASGKLASSLLGQAMEKMQITTRGTFPPPFPLGSVPYHWLCTTIAAVNCTASVAPSLARAKARQSVPGCSSWMPSGAPTRQALHSVRAALKRQALQTTRRTPAVFLPTTHRQGAARPQVGAGLTLV